MSGRCGWVRGVARSASKRHGRREGGDRQQRGQDNEHLAVASEGSLVGRSALVLDPFGAEDHRQRALARQLGLTATQLRTLVRVSYVKVAEFQRRARRSSTRSCAWTWLRSAAAPAAWPRRPPGSPPPTSSGRLRGGRGGAGAVSTSRPGSGCAGPVRALGHAAWRAQHHPNHHGRGPWGAVGRAGGRLRGQVRHQGDEDFGTRTAASPLTTSTPSTRSFRRTGPIRWRGSIC
jgi:hypothetical protein